MRRIGTMAMAGFGVLGLSSTAAAQLNPRARPLSGTESVGPSRGANTRGMAGGPISLSDVSSGCRGYAQAAPNHVVNVPLGISSIRMEGLSGIDTTLFVQAPDGRILCDDDGGDGNNPLLEFAAGPGQYRVWVGAYSSSQSGPYDLRVTVGAASVPGQVTGPMFGTITMHPGGRPDPIVAQGTGGGQISASTFHPDCRGFITPQPSHVVRASGPFPNLRLVVQSDTDTVLVARYPNGRILCDDDSGGGLNPLIDSPVDGGDIQVWIGTYSSGRTAAYTLGVTSRSDVMPPMLSGVAPPVQMPPTPPQPPVQPQPPTQPQPPGLPTISARVDLLPRVPVTLIGPGMQPGTAAVWQPREGGRVEIATLRGRSGWTIVGVVNGQMETVVTVPFLQADNTLVTVTLRPDGRLFVRAEVAPSGGDQGQQLLALIQMLNGIPVVAEQWTGEYGARGPRWSR